MPVIERRRTAGCVSLSSGGREEQDRMSLRGGAGGGGCTQLHLAFPSTRAMHPYLERKQELRMIT